MFATQSSSTAVTVKHKASWPWFFGLLSLLSLLCLSSAQVWADDFAFITQDELVKEMQAQKSQKMPSVTPRFVAAPGSPQLTILAPSIQTPVRKTPVRIEIGFQPEAGARIVPESFRVLYGMLRLDITERLRKHGTVNEKGAVAEKAELPSGSHRLYLKIADNQGRIAEREMHITVELE